jgi:hypothetical protein
MSEIYTPVNPRPAINPLRIVAAILYFLVAVTSLFNGELLNLPYNYQYFDDQPLEVQVFIIHHTFSLIAIPLGAIGLGLIALLSKKKALLLILSIAYFVLIAPLSWILQLFIAANYEGWVVLWTMPFMDTNGYWSDGPFVIAKLVGFTLALLLAIVASVTSANSAPATVASEAVLVNPTSVPNGQTYSAGSTVSNLPIFALVGAFFFPIVGVVLGHISLSQMKKGQIPSDNRGLALAGLILGYVFIGIGFIASIIVIITLIVSAASLNSY